MFNFGKVQKSSVDLIFKIQLKCNIFCSKENVLVSIEDIIKSDDAPVSGASPDQVVDYEEIEEIDEPELPDRTAWTNQQDEDDGLEIDYSGTPV